MSAITEQCSVCGGDFAVQFRYQTEEIVDRDETGRDRVRFAYYCTQACLDRSHRGDGRGSVGCDACGTSFTVELASQVLFAGGRRRYACSAACRADLRAEAGGQRLGAGFAPDGSGHDADLPPVLDPRRASVSAPPPSAQRPATGTRVLAVFNHKGGTGKTTTSVTLAAGLAKRGQRVLLVDTDGQGNVGVSLGLGSDRSLYHVLVMGLDPRAVIQRTTAGFDVLPANETLAAAELYLAGRKGRDRVLAARLESVRDDYDFVLVDCSPSLSLLNQNALVFADGVLCPVACDYLSLVGVRQVVKTLKQVNQLLGHPVRLWGVLPTLFDARARICHEALDTLREHFGARCFEPIRNAIKVKEAPAQGQTLLDYAPGSSAALDYLRVVDRLLAEHASTLPAPLPGALAAGGMR